MPFYGGVRGAWGGAAAEVCKIQGGAFCGGTNNSSWQGSPPPAWLPRVVFPPWLLGFGGCLPCLADGAGIIPPSPRGGKDTMQVVRQLVYTVFTIRFTCGDTKILSNIKMSQNIMTRIVGLF